MLVLWAGLCKGGPGSLEAHDRRVEQGEGDLASEEGRSRTVGWSSFTERRLASHLNVTVAEPPLEESTIGMKKSCSLLILLSYILLFSSSCLR